MSEKKEYVKPETFEGSIEEIFEMLKEAYESDEFDERMLDICKFSLLYRFQNLKGEQK